MSPTFRWAVDRFRCIGPAIEPTQPKLARRASEGATALRPAAETGSVPMSLLSGMR